MRRLCVLVTAVLMGAVIQPGSALAGASPVYTRVLHAYQATGRIPPCEFTSAELESALSGVDTYGQQYYADFIGAIQAALTARAAGACAKTHGRGVGGVGHPSSGSSGHIPGARAVPSSITASTRSGLPLPMVLVVVLGALLAAAAALSRWGWAPGWPTSWRHGAAEARYRTEGAWLGLRDRLRR